MRKAAISCWNLVSPFAAGIGIASAAVSFVIGLYYNTMVAWTLLYLWGSLTQKPLPFTVCPPENGGEPRNSSGSGSGPVLTADSLSSNEASGETECQVRLDLARRARIFPFLMVIPLSFDILAKFEANNKNIETSRVAKLALHDDLWESEITMKE